jgi:hypothetical protein
MLLHPRSELKLLHITNLLFRSFLDAAVVAAAVAAVVGAGYIAFFSLKDVQYVSRKICGISYAAPVITLPRLASSRWWSKAIRKTASRH